MAKLTAIRLSENPNTKVITMPNGYKGQANEASNGRPFILLEFVDDSNIFKFSRAVRSYFANDNGKWSGAEPAQLELYVGKTIPGKFVTLPVAEYQIEGSTNMARSYTTFVMPHENELTVFTAAGHTVLDSEGNVIAEPRVGGGTQTPAAPAATNVVAAPTTATEPAAVTA